LRTKYLKTTGTQAANLKDLTGAIGALSKEVNTLKSQIRHEPIGRRNALTKRQEELKEKITKLRDTYFDWKEKNAHRLDFSNTDEAFDYGENLNKDTTNALKDALATTTQTEAQAADVLNELDEQTGKLEQVHAELTEIDKLIGSAGEVMDSIYCKEKCGSCGGYVLRVLLVLQIIFYIILRVGALDKAMGVEATKAAAPTSAPASKTQ
jgi:DNA repair exonuclease SbcCD ATPase subunit